MYDKFYIFIRERNCSNSTAIVTIYDEEWKEIGKHGQSGEDKLENIINTKYIAIASTNKCTNFKIVDYVTGNIVVTETGKFIGWIDSNKIMSKHGSVLKVKEIESTESELTEIKLKEIKLKEIKIINECVICCDELIEKYVMIPCGHTNVCNVHLKDLIQCPSCRSTIDSTNIVFI